MNDDFEKELHALTRALHRPDPTPAWKADILARARREADVLPMKRMLPPRWLMTSWAAAWIAIVALDFTAPEDAPPAFALDTVPPVKQTPSNGTLPQGDLPALIAFHQYRNLNLDLP